MQNIFATLPHLEMRLQVVVFDVGLDHRGCMAFSVCHPDGLIRCFARLGLNLNQKPVGVCFSAVIENRLKK